MRWGKANRNKPNVAETKVEADDKWKKFEMKLHKDGIMALAAAVIMQWKDDGRPKQDEEMIAMWSSLLNDCIKEHDEKGYTIRISRSSNDEE